MSKKGRQMEQQKPAAAAGRPEGSVTSKAEAAREIKPVCRNAACGSSDLAKKNVLNDMAHYQLHEDGEATTRRKWTRAMCRKCGVWQTIITDYNP